MGSKKSLGFNFNLLCVSYIQAYLISDPTDRSEDTTPLIRIHQGKEPRSFKRIFPSWDEGLWEVKE